MERPPSRNAKTPMLLPLEALEAAAVLGCVLLTAPMAGAAESAEGGPPTFVRDVAPLLHENCAGCHRPGEIGPMALRTYDEVRPWARSIARVVEARDMPPWDADPGYGPWKNDISLHENEVETILQ